MRPDATAFRWTPTREQAALAVAQDAEGDRAIAASLGIDKATLERWKGRREFQARVAKHRERWREELAEVGVADRRNRIAQINDVVARLGKVIEERAAEPLLAHVAGGKTGMIVAEPVVVRSFAVSGPDDDGPMTPARESVVRYRYTVDIATVRELANLAKQAAMDLGEWGGKGGAAVTPAPRPAQMALRRSCASTGTPCTTPLTTSSRTK